jgi:hypothetical protein
MCRGQGRLLTAKVAKDPLRTRSWPASARWTKMQRALSREAMRPLLLGFTSSNSNRY